MGTCISVLAVRYRGAGRGLGRRGDEGEKDSPPEGEKTEKDTQPAEGEKERAREREI